jgi:MarR family transcriptional regulator, organic hydroperoxide resistance regulator
MDIKLRDIVDRIGQLNIIHRIYIHRAAAENGIYFGQLPILEYVSSHGQCTQTELAETLQVSAPSIATSVKRMQKTGLLKKVADESDLRCNRISITEKGLDLAQKCRSAFDTVDARMFEGFSAVECEELRRYLERLIANVATDEFKNKTMFALINTVTAEKQQHCKQEEDS